MEWSIEWYPHFGIGAVRKNHPEPEVPFYAQRYLTAFFFLTHDRLNSFNGMGHIPLSAKMSYCELFNVLDRKSFVRVLTEMDAAYVSKAMAIHAKKEAKK